MVIVASTYCLQKQLTDIVQTAIRNKGKIFLYKKLNLHHRNRNQANKSQNF